MATKIMKATPLNRLEDEYEKRFNEQIPIGAIGDGGVVRGRGVDPAPERRTENRTAHRDVQGPAPARTEVLKTPFDGFDTPEAFADTPDAPRGAKKLQNAEYMGILKDLDKYLGTQYTADTDSLDYYPDLNPQHPSRSNRSAELVAWNTSKPLPGEGSLRLTGPKPSTSPPVHRLGLTPEAPMTAQTNPRLFQSLTPTPLESLENPALRSIAKLLRTTPDLSLIHI